MNNIILQNLFFNDLTCLIPELYLTGVIIFLLIFALLINNCKSLKNPYMLSIISKLLILSFSLTSLLYINNITYNYKLLLNQFVSSDLIIFFKVFILIISIVVLLISLDYYHKENFNTYEYAIIYSLAIVGMLIMLSSNDFILFYLSIELQSLSLYLLAAYKKYSNFSTEAGLKYFILGAFSSGLLLFGISLIYGFTGLTNLDEISYLLTDINFTNSLYNPCLLGFLFIISAFFFKLAIVPFHMWAPDVYQGSPTIVTLFFSVLPKLAVLIFLVRLINTTFIEFAYDWNQLLSYTALLSLIIGALGAIYQTQIKRLLAYSAISHMGFISLALLSNTNEGLFAFIFYIIVYVIINLNIFSIILSLRNRVTGQLVKNIKDIAPIINSNIILAISFTLILFSIGGIPPFIGFFSKFYVFLSLIENKLYFISIIGILSSVLGIIYYIRLIRIMFFNSEVNNISLFFFEVNKTKSYIISLTLLINIFFFIKPGLLIFTVTNFIVELLF